MAVVMAIAIDVDLVVAIEGLYRKYVYQEF